MVQQLGLSQAKGSERLPIEGMVTKEGYRPVFDQSRSDLAPARCQDLDGSVKMEEASSGESRDTLHEPTFPKFSQTSHLRMPTPRQSYSKYRDSPTSSRPNSLVSSSRPNLPSSVTSASITVDVPPDPKNTEIQTTRRPSILTRLRSSISTSGTSPLGGARRLSAQPSNFQRTPEQPEKHFIDSIGMVIPGVCNRSRCAHPLAHFVTNWRLCEPIEYTTALADHGITYSDYCQLIAALANYLDEIPNEPKRRARSIASWWYPSVWKAPNDHNARNWEDSISQAPILRNNSIAESAHQFKIAEQQAVAVMVCISSFSLFTPNRISESHVQILHVSPQAPTPTSEVNTEPRSPTRLSFIDPFAITKLEVPSVAVPRHQLNRRSRSPPSPSSPFSGVFLHHHQQLQLRDRTRPWPLWPNAIPSRKRELMNYHSDRYGVDPYFRAWMRANINSRTRSTSYAKYMIEQEDSPFINTRHGFQEMEGAIPQCREQKKLRTQS